MIRNRISKLLCWLADQIGTTEPDPPITGKYEIRNCTHGNKCRLSGNIDTKVVKKQFHPEIDDEGLAYCEAVCDRCCKGIRVVHEWEGIQTALYLNHPFIVDREEIEPEKFFTNRKLMLEKINDPLIQPPLTPATGNPEENIIDISSKVAVFDQITALLFDSHIGDGYGNQRIAAELAVDHFGINWAFKNPRTENSMMIRSKLMNIVRQTTPDWHSNHYVIWQRFQKYAHDYVPKT